jgi:hypothetical protein
MIRFDFLWVDTRRRSCASLTYESSLIDMDMFSLLELVPEDEMADLMRDREALPLLRVPTMYADGTRPIMGYE